MHRPDRFPWGIRMRRTSILCLLLSLAACSRGETDAPTPEPAPSAEEGTATDEGAAQAAAGPGTDDGAHEATDQGSGDAPAEGSAELIEAAPMPPPETDVRALVAGHGPLDPAVREIVWRVPEDDVPEVLNATREDLENRHYLTCDELNLHVWYEQLRDIGGAYAGVGSDQAYTFIGWMRPQLAWLTDYDPWVRTLHKIYLLAFENSETIEGFREFWDPDNQDASWELIEARWSEDRDFRLMRPVFRDWGSRVNRRFRRYNRILTEAEIPWFLNDQEMYEFVRDFTMSGRVRPLLANLLDDTALSAIGDASRELGVPIRAFYLSNAEDYWRYPDQFRQNFQDLHFDEQSWILRTNATKRQNGDYRYCAQSALNFQQWLQQDYVSRIDDIWEHPYVENEEHIPVTVIGADAVPEERD